jgi:hypothetical protein
MAKARSEAFKSYTKELHADLQKLLDAGKPFSEAAKAKALNVSTSLTYTVSDVQNQKFANSYSIAYGAMTLKKGQISEAIPASASLSLFVYVEDRQPGDALASEMMRSQIRNGIARATAVTFSPSGSHGTSKQEFAPLVR